MYTCRCHTDRYVHEAEADAPRGLQTKELTVRETIVRGERLANTAGLTRNSLANTSNCLANTAGITRNSLANTAGITRTLGRRSTQGVCRGSDPQSSCTVSR